MNQLDYPFIFQNRCLRPSLLPNKHYLVQDIIASDDLWKHYPKALAVLWVTQWDSVLETDYWYVIKDTPFSISDLKSKRRYEINKGNRNFNVRVLSSSDIPQMYDVYLESMKGYSKKPRILKLDEFEKDVFVWFNYDDTIGGGRKMIVWGAFDIESGEMCGYAHVIKYNDHCSFSTLKTKPSSEAKGVNAALCYQVVMDCEVDLARGDFYISDGARNLSHETHFQDYLCKYFLFRKAYCCLNVRYSQKMKYIVKLIYPFRRVLNIFDQIKVIHAINSLLKIEQTSRNCKLILHN